MATNRNFVEGTSGTFHRILIQLSATFQRKDDGIHTGTFGRTGNGSDIAHIGNFIQHQQERHPTLFINLRYYVENALVFYG